MLHNSSSPHAIGTFLGEASAAAWREAHAQRNGTGGWAVVGTPVDELPARYAVYNAPLPLTRRESLDVKLVLAVLASIFLLIPFCYIPASAAVFVVGAHIDLPRPHSILQTASRAAACRIWIRRCASASPSRSTCNWSRAPILVSTGSLPIFGTWSCTHASSSPACSSSLPTMSPRSSDQPSRSVCPRRVPFRPFPLRSTPFESPLPSTSLLYVLTPARLLGPARPRPSSSSSSYTDSRSSRSSTATPSSSTRQPPRRSHPFLACLLPASLQSPPTPHTATVLCACCPPRHRALLTMSIMPCSMCQPSRSDLDHHLQLSRRIWHGHRPPDHVDHRGHQRRRRHPDLDLSPPPWLQLRGGHSQPDTGTTPRSNPLVCLAP